MTRTIHCILTVVILTAPLFAATPSADTEKLWSLEKAHWEYVQANDLQNSSPCGTQIFSAGRPLAQSLCAKITSRTGSRRRRAGASLLQSYDLEPLSTQVTGDVPPLRIGFA